MVLIALVSVIEDLCNVLLDTDYLDRYVYFDFTVDQIRWRDRLQMSEIWRFSK